jgi:hypothetical protein
VVGVEKANNNKNTITFSPFGNYINQSIKNASPNLSKQALIENGVLTPSSADRMFKFITDFYLSIVEMIDLRSLDRTPENQEALRCAEKLVKDKADCWFILVGTRPRKTKNGPLRPAYGTTYVDLSMFSECATTAMQIANNDLTKVVGVFFEILVLNTSKLLSGQGINRITKEELEKAKAEKYRPRIKKANETRADNSKKKNSNKEISTELAIENNKLKLENAELKEQVAKLQKYVKELQNAISKSDISDEQKKALL